MGTTEGSLHSDISGLSNGASRLCAVPTRNQMPRHIAEMCDRMARAMVDDKFEVQMKMNDIDRLDLIGAGLQRAVEFWPKFDASRGNQPQTPLHLAIERGMKDFIKKEESQQRRKAGLAWEMGGKKAPVKEVPKEDGLVALLTRIFNVAKREHMNKYTQGRRLHTTPQLVAIAVFMDDQCLGCRECARLFAAREDLRNVLRMKHLPSYNAIWGSKKLYDKVVTEPAPKPAEVVTLNDPKIGEVVTLPKTFFEISSAA